jgi:signal transduction histidine kinase
MTSETESGQARLTALERRLDRLRFDLHDGPQQELHLLALDLQLFREQLLPSIEDDANRDRLLGHLDDLFAQLAALVGELRRLITSVESPFVRAGSLAEPLSELTAGFAARTGVKPEVQVEGELSRLSDSQRIALLALIREALSNIRKHGEAAHVAVSIRGDAGGVRASVVDDGRGFEPDTTLPQAAEEGHLGIVGMCERMRMLGGETTIESRPGGPTVISVVLPWWDGETPAEQTP